MRKIIATLTAAAVAAAACAGLMHEEPRLPETPPAVVQALAPASQDNSPEEDAEETKSRRRSSASVFGLAWRLFVTAPLSLLGHLLSALATPLAGSAAAVLHVLLGDILFALLAFFIPLCLLLHALFPERSLRSLLAGKRLPCVLLLSLAVPLLCRLLSQAFPQAESALLLLRILLSLVLVGTAAWAFVHRENACCRSEAPERLYAVCDGFSVPLPQHDALPAPSAAEKGEWKLSEK